MTPQQLRNLQDIRILLADAYRDLLKEKGKVRHGSEGVILIHYSGFGEDPDTMEANGITIHTAVGGMGKKTWLTPLDSNKQEDPTERALFEIKNLHSKQLARNHNKV